MALQVGLVAIGAALAGQSMLRNRTSTDEKQEKIRSLTSALTTSSTTQQMIDASINRLKDEIGILMTSNWNPSIRQSSDNMLAKFAGISSASYASAFPSQPLAAAMTALKQLAADLGVSVASAEDKLATATQVGEYDFSQLDGLILALETTRDTADLHLLNQINDLNSLLQTANASV